MERRYWVTLMGIVVAALVLRLYGLSAVGIFQDEKYMVLAVGGVLETGLPYLPSGMFYPRALGQIYLMSGSVAVFGEGVWAYRLPSVIAGTLCVVLAFMLGRQYLGPTLSLSLAATVAFLPNFIEISQIARMYVFLVLVVFAFLILMTYWLRRGGWGPVAALILVLAVGIEFQPLTIFLLPLALLPVVVAPSWLRAVQTTVIVVATLAVYSALDAFVARQYAGSISSEGAIGARHATPLENAGFMNVSPVVVVVSLVAAVLVVWSVLWLLKSDRKPALDASPLAAGLSFGLGALGLTVSVFAAALFTYQIALLAFLFGAAFALRAGAGLRALAVVVAGLAVIAVSQAIWVLISGDVASVKDFARYFLSFPSPGPEMSFTGLFPWAVAVFLALFLLGLWRFGRGGTLSLDVPLVTLGVIIPMLVIGVMLWAVAPRYLYGLVPVFLLALFLGIDRCRIAAVARWGDRPGIHGSFAVVAAFLVVSPFGVLTALDRSYQRFPDHAGAAEFIQSRQLAANDLIMAMDAPIQTYYLGRIDYLLRYIESAGWQARRHGDEIVDIFTGTPVLTDGERFERVLLRPGRGAIYVVGSGEIHGEVAYAFNLGPDIPDLLDEHGAEVVFTGRDDRTRVWRLPPPDNRLVCKPSWTCEPRLLSPSLTEHEARP